MARRHVVQISKLAQKQIKRLPRHIQGALELWKDLIQTEGVQAIKNIPGYHDESLMGNRRGQRSCRLSRSYRVIYEELDSDEINIILVLEVNKHDY